MFFCFKEFNIFILLIKKNKIDLIFIIYQYFVFKKMKAKYSFDNAKQNVISSKQAYSLQGETRSANVSTNMISSGSNDAYDMGPNNKRKV